MINLDFNIKYSEQSANDLSEIISYIKDDLCSPIAAKNFYTTVKEKLEFLREHPYMYPLYHDKKLSKKGYRYIVIGNYLIFYIIDKESSIVNILRILYSGRDMFAIFDE